KGVRVNFVNSSVGPLSRVLQEDDSQWQVLHHYTFGVQRFMQSTPSANARFYLWDASSVVAVADGNAALNEVYSYDSFGLPSGNGGSNSYLFDGEAFDAEASLIYLRARYYDPSIGRFISRDPISGSLSDPPSWGTYVYAKNDPVNLEDPTGLDPMPGESFYFKGNEIKAFVGPKITVTVINNSSSVVPTFLAFDYYPVKDGKYTLGNRGEVLIGGAKGPIPIGKSGVTFTLSDSEEGAILLIRSIDGNVAAYKDGTVSLRVTSSALENNPSPTPPVGPLEDIAPTPPFGPQRDGPKPRDINFEEGDTENSPVFFEASVSDSLDLGGVDLNKTADLLLSVQDVTGATFDAATGQIVILGKDNIALPPLDMNHVAVAVQSEYGGQDPGVSIDPPILNNQMSVRYEGATRNTRFGDIMFEADRTLKILTLGKDNVTGQAVTSSVPGYKNLLQRRLAAGCNGMPTSTRMWFQPKEVRLVPSTDGKSMVFDAVSMELLYESKVGNQVVSDPQAAAFAAHFTQNYEAFAAEWPILEKLEQLGKIVGIIKWIKDNHIPIDLSFLADFPIEVFTTNTATPAVSAQGTVQNGPIICTVTLQGGVTYITPNQYLTADPAAGAALAEALSHRPSEGTFKWTYQPSSLAAARLKTSSSNPVTAVSESLTRSRRNGNTHFREVDLSSPLPGGGRLSLVRSYNSFFDLTGPLGPGWSVLPAELRFPVGRETFTFGSVNLSLSLYGRIWVTERNTGREDAYDLLGIDSSNLPIYQRADTPNVLRQQSDGTFLLTRANGSKIVFRADGKPASLTDRNGNTVSFTYDAQAKLLHLDAAGQTITLTYAPQGRLTQASGPGSRQVSYGYDAQGRCTTFTDSAGRSRSYGYDTSGRLASATDAAGQTVLSSGYDDYDRTPSRKIGAAAQYLLGFDLTAGQSTVTDPFGRVSQRTFERRQLATATGLPNEVLRPTQAVDPLGNRSQMTWANDAFGPRTVTNAQGATTQLAWDNRGHLTSVQDALGKTSHQYYDWRDRLVAAQDAEGLATGYGYDDKNNLTSVYHDIALNFDTSGNLTSFYYDPAKVATLGYDAVGNLTTATSPQGQAAHIDRNGAGQATRITT